MVHASPVRNRPWNPHRMHPDPKSGEEPAIPRRRIERSIWRAGSRSSCHGELPFHLGSRILRLRAARHDRDRRLEALCALHRVELPVSGRRQPGSSPISTAFAGQASGNGWRRSRARQRRSRSRPIFVVPDSFIFFGILHEIALASVLGLAFLRLPPLLTLAVAVAVIALPQFFRADRSSTSRRFGGSACRR